MVTDTHWRTSYYVTKSLARRGIKVIGLKSDASRYDKSKYYHTIISVASPETDQEAWLSSVEETGSGKEYLIPISVETIQLVAKHSARLEAKFILPPTDLEKIAMATDKLRSIELMAGIGIPIPATYVPNSLQEAEDIFQRLPLPVVIKLRKEQNIPPEKRYGIAESLEDCLALYRTLSSRQPRPIIQQYVQGQGMGISILANQGKILAKFSHQRLREQKPTGGPSTYCTAIDSRTLEEFAVKFAEWTGWNGVAMLEFKFNRAENQYYFMEINPRFWGSIELAIKSGVDFPYLYIMWLGNQAQWERPITRKRNIKLKFLSMDLEGFAQQLRLVEKKGKIKAVWRYAAEYFDWRLRLAHIGFDWRISFPEIYASFRALWKVLKNIV